MRFLDDCDYASENATRNIVNWHKETEEGGIWLDMGNEHEKRKVHHGYIESHQNTSRTHLTPLTLVLGRCLIEIRFRNG